MDESNAKSLGIQWGNLVRLFRLKNTQVNTGGFASLGVGTLGIIPGIHIQAVLSMLQTLNGVDILSITLWSWYLIIEKH